MDKNIRMILVELRSSIFPPESVDFPINSHGDRIDQIESGIINFVEKLGEISKKDNIDLDKKLKDALHRLGDTDNDTSLNYTNDNDYQEVYNNKANY